MNISLSQFARDLNLAKATVFRKCQELNIPTSNGLTPEDCDRLRREFPTAAAAQVEVESGNHQITVAPAQLPQSYTLEGLRQTEALVIEDPLAVAQQFLQVADQLQVAMQTDIQQRQQRLDQTRQAKDAIATKRQQLELEARLYQLQTQTLDSAQTAEVQSLQDSLAALQRMGKPVESAQP